MKKISIISTIIEYLLLILLIAVSFFSFFPKILFFAQRSINFYAISSGSMEPAIKTGSIIYVSKFKPDELHEKDIITFLHKGSDNKDVVVTHRIVKIEDLSKTISNKKVINYRITTKGDANRTSDSNKISLSQILGKYSFSLPYIGFVVLFAQKPLGFIILVVIPAVTLIIIEIVSIILYFKNKFEQKAKKEIELLKNQYKREKKKK